jgi:xanthine/CO dehydrogenase XdhC/CoxF family maturation factor
MTHHFLHDLDILEFLLGTEAPYVGILGPRQRTENLLRELERRGARRDPARLARLYGPLGLDIGADTPEEIALAALAEVRAVLSRRAGGSLRERTGPLHEAPP